MAAPVKLGHLVLYKTSLVNALKPAVVTEIPLVQVNGASNFDADGNPYVVDLLVLGMQGTHPRYRIPHEASGHHEYFILLDEAPDPSVQDVESQR